jgi:excisionase family DNA binding protein
MKSRPTQFGMRENTASSRRHASRLAAVNPSNTICIEETPETQQPSSEIERLATATENQLHATPQCAATAKEERDRNHLLTVHEVAALLQVPVSWIYGRMRKRSSERLPGYRLGKYWRFHEDEVLAWVESQRDGSHAA